MRVDHVLSEEFLSKNINTSFGDFFYDNEGYLLAKAGMPGAARRGSGRGLSGGLRSRLFYDFNRLMDEVVCGERSPEQGRGLVREMVRLRVER